MGFLHSFEHVFCCSIDGLFSWDGGMDAISSKTSEIRVSLKRMALGTV